MECSICYSEINGATGKVELSCSHPYHFSCLTKWFDKQRMKGSSESCPLCRHVANEFETMPSGIDDAASSDSYDTWVNTAHYHPFTQEPLEADDITWINNVAPVSLESSDIEAQPVQHLTHIIMLRLCGKEKEVDNYAASRINACWRGYQARLLCKNLRRVNTNIRYAKKIIEKNRVVIEKQTDNLVSANNRRRFLRSTVGMSRMEVKLCAVRKIQKKWRTYYKNEREERLWREKRAQGFPGSPGIWRKVDSGNWEKVIMNPEEDLP